MEDKLSGIQTYRNPKIVHVLDKLGIIEDFGPGIGRTIESYSTYNGKPEFEPTENFSLLNFLIRIIRMTH